MQLDNLIKRACRKDADAFTDLMQSQMQNMYKAARALLQNDEDVADAIADTILTCWEKIGQLKKAEFFRTWLTKILINKCNDILRQKKEVYLTNEVEELSEVVSEYDNVEWLETLKSLDEKYRLIMILHYVNGLKPVEISTVLHMPASTVRTRLSRGKEQMASIYHIDMRSVSKTAKQKKYAT